MRDGTSADLVSIGISDVTADGHLTLYGSVADSASSWVPSHTVLLIASPRWRLDLTAKLSLDANTQVHIDPDMTVFDQFTASDVG